MNQTGGALSTVEYWIVSIIAFLATIFGVIEDSLRGLLNQLGVPGDIQRVVILVVAVVFIIAVLRFFGGFFRILLALFLILLVLHILLPNLGL
jgi:hypothetical protein